MNYASEMVQNRSTIQRYHIYWALICIIIAVFVSVVISHRLSRPIMRLRTSMQSVEQGNFDISVDVASNNEIGDLAKDFNIMIAQIKNLVRRNAEEQELKRKSELLALQNQITPHFLYNTLDSVIWMAEGRHYDNVITTVSALARLLRLSVSRGDELISVRDEVDHIRSYLTIQKLRYRDKLDFAINVDTAIMHLRTPKVILQPLVENAIYHGIKNKDHGGSVTVTGKLLGGEVVLTVGDDGIGMSREKRRTVLEGPVPEAGEEMRERAGSEHSGAADNRGIGESVDSEVPTTGYRVRISRLPRTRARVGVRNVHERIQLYFGDAYGLSFRRNEGGGTVVDVRIPIVDPAEDDDE